MGYATAVLPQGIHGLDQVKSETGRNRLVHDYVARETHHIRYISSSAVLMIESP
jgi:hypothetical protein